MAKKRPKSKSQPSSAKIPRTLPEHSPDKDYNHCPVWQFSLIDFDHGEWGWKNFKGIELQKKIIAQLGGYEKRFWKEIRQDRKRDHAVKRSDLSEEAQKRLEVLRLDDHDELFRIRLSGKERVWGILERYIFKILWWDPEHTVCPSGKKNT